MGLFLIAYRNWAKSEVLMFLGLAAVLYIIEDFNVGPSSDLEQYAKIFVVIPAAIWMYLWLGIVLALTALNLRILFKPGNKQKP